MNEFIIGDIRTEVMDLCVVKKGKWWASAWFRNKEVDDMFEEIMGSPLSTIYARLSRGE